MWNDGSVDQTPIDPMADLVAAGTVLPPTVSSPLAMLTTPAENGSDAGELVSSMRGD
jgi:hypothetical protein